MKIKELFFKGFIYSCLVWVFIAAGFQFTMLGLELTGHEDKLKEMGDWLSVRIDGIYKDDPRNIAYHFYH